MMIVGLILAAIVLVTLFAAMIVALMFVQLWIQAKAVGLPVSLVDMLMMRLRGVAPEEVVGVMIPLWKAGLEVPQGYLEAHVLAGGHLRSVGDALIAADKAELGVDFAKLAAIDLAGRDVGDAVNARVKPKVLQCPPPGSGIDGIAGVAQDGIRIAARARVTVRAQLDRLVGGAGENTVIARVGEGIVAAIGRAASHRDILEHPERISEYLLEKGLDSGTCFEILSVDIGDVDVLDNVAARLRSSQADADKRIAQAQAEVRRAAAVAARQEMTARTTQMQGRLVSATSTVPLAVSSAFAEANMGVRTPLRPLINARVRWQRVQ